MRITNIIKGLIIRDNKLLVIKNSEDIYLLPETVQDYQESMAKSLESECIEKFGILVDVEDVVFIKEEIDDSFDALSHRIEYYFICTIVDEINQAENQKMLEWIEIDKIMDYHICPITLRPFILDYNKQKMQKVYLGELD